MGAGVRWMGDSGRCLLGEEAVWGWGELQWGTAGIHLFVAMVGAEWASIESWDCARETNFRNLRTALRKISKPVVAWQIRADQELQLSASSLQSSDVSE